MKVTVNLSGIEWRSLALPSGEDGSPYELVPDTLKCNGHPIKLSSLPPAVAELVEAALIHRAECLAEENEAAERQARDGMAFRDCLPIWRGGRGAGQ